MMYMVKAHSPTTITSNFNTCTTLHVYPAMCCDLPCRDCHYVMTDWIYECLGTRLTHIEHVSSGVRRLLLQTHIQYSLLSTTDYSNVLHNP